MKKIVGLSLGCVYKFFNPKNKNDTISLYRNTFGEDLKAIEILIPEKNINNFVLADENRSYLDNNLDYVSFHIGATEDENLKLIKTLNQYSKYDNIVSHINNFKNVPSYFFNLFNQRVLKENIETVYNFEDCFSICFDTAHAMKSGKKYFEKFVKNNKYNFKQIHLSNYCKKKLHTTLYNNADDFFWMKNKIDFKKFPIIIESPCNDLNELKKEFYFVKENI